MRFWPLLSIACLLCPRFHSHAAAAWQPVATGAERPQFVAVTALEREPAHVFAATPDALYETTDGGRTWRLRASAPGSALRTLYALPTAPLTLLAGTDAGLYSLSGAGDDWTLLTRRDGLAARCTRLARGPDPREAWLGTEAGLWHSDDGGRQWRPVSGPFDGHAIVDVAADRQAVYVLTAERLFSTAPGSGAWSERFQHLAPAETADDDAMVDGQAPDALLARPILRAITLHPRQPGALYLATARGVFFSGNEGHDWQRLNAQGLPALDTTKLLLPAQTPAAPYAVTTRGIARYSPASARWQPLGAGLSAAAIAELASSGSLLWAATNQGLFRWDLSENGLADTGLDDPRELLADFPQEPAIAAVQAAVIRYAEVHPSKIQRWRRQAALQALLPSFSVGLDHDRTYDWHVDEGSYPNYQLFQTSDRNASMDLSVNWDLGELIWNDDQTSIDTRAKLMVELREDLVDQVTRTYFERRRLQARLLLQPPAEPQALLEQELRIAELTALIDGLSGGYFSAAMGRVPTTQEVQ